MKVQRSLMMLGVAAVLCLEAAAAGARDAEGSPSLPPESERPKGAERSETSPVREGAERSETPPVREGAERSETKLRARVIRSIDRGLTFLQGQQRENGSWEDYPAITALALKCFFDSPARPREADHPFLARGMAYLVSKARSSGAIYDRDLALYNTSIAVLALRASGNPAHEPPIQRARAFLVEMQADEGEGLGSADLSYGGFGYGPDSRPDMSNLATAVEALREAGVAEDSAVWERVVTFVSRCQNNTSTNDAAGAGDDGGLYYSPSESKAGRITLANGQLGYKSYGSMTYAGLKSFIYAHVDKDDPRVQAALQWVRNHYTVDENPEMGRQGLYYYYHTFAKALDAYGEETIVDASGTEHHWRAELAEKLLSLQREDGSWQNVNPRWWESNPVLVTSYAVLALEICLK